MKVASGYYKAATAMEGEGGVLMGKASLCTVLSVIDYVGCTKLHDERTATTTLVGDGAKVGRSNMVVTGPPPQTKIKFIKKTKASHCFRKSS